MQALLSSRRGDLIFIMATVAGTAVFGFAIGVLMGPHAAILGDRLGELTCLQLAFGGERAASIVTSFPPEARNAIARLLWPGDMVFAWGYGLQFAGLVGLLARRLTGAWFRAGAIVVWLPLAASLLDCIEDLFLHQIVTQLIGDPAAAVSDAPALAAGLSASLKYFFLSVVTPMFALAGSVQGFRHDRRIGSLVIYLLVSALSLSVVLRPAQQIPACF